MLKIAAFLRFRIGARSLQEKTQELGMCLTYDP